MSRGPLCQHVNGGSPMCRAAASNLEACMWKYVSFTAGCCRTVLKKKKNILADQACFSSAHCMISGLVWSWVGDLQITDRMCRGHTGPEMDVEKARLIHQCSGRSKRWRYETASRGSRALTAPTLKSLGSWLTLSRCWGGRAATETINTLHNLAKTHISRKTIKSPLSASYRLWRSIFNKLEPAHSSCLHCFSHVTIKLLFRPRVQTAVRLAVSASNANHWSFCRGFCTISTCSSFGIGNVHPSSLTTWCAATS